MVTILRPLGALPIIGKIAISIVSWMVKSRLSAYQAAKQAAAEYEIFQTLTERQISELAFELGRKTEFPEWEWFTVLRWAQEFGLITPEPPIPAHEPDAAHDAAETPLWMWAIVAGIGVIALLSIR